MPTEIDGIRGLPLAERAAALSSVHEVLVRALDDDAALDELPRALERSPEGPVGSGETPASAILAAPGEDE